jgi:hypothetical protein
LADISYFTAIFSAHGSARKTVVELAVEGKSKFRVEAFEKKSECVGRFPWIEIRDYRHNTKAPPQNAEDKRSWTRARVISTRRRKFSAAIYSRRRATTRVAPTNQPLVGARICDNIKLRRHAP